MNCKNCGHIININQKFCDKCGAENIEKKAHNEKHPISSKKQPIIISILILIGIGIFIFIVIYIGISNNNSSSKTSTATTSSTSKSDTTSENIIFDAKKLVGAKKQVIDVLLGVTGIQDTNEPYVYHYGDDMDVVFDDDGICLDLCLDTREKGYKSFNETEIFKSYGIDLVDSYYKQSSDYVKSRTQIKGFGEIVIFYNSDKESSSSDIGQIIFYTKSSEALNNFLDEKSKSLENKSNNNTNTKNTNNNSISSVREERLKYKIVYDANKSDLYNDYCYEVESIEGDASYVVDSNNINIANDKYNKYNDLINRMWTDLKKQLPTDKYDKLLKEELAWIKDKTSKYPTADSTDGTFKDKVGAIKMTDERIGKLLKYVN